MADSKDYSKFIYMVLSAQTTLHPRDSCDKCVGLAITI